MAQKETNRYQGMTRRNYKILKAKSCSTPGRQKNELCQASGLQKAMAKYPRAIKTNPEEYFKFNLKKDKLARRENTFFVRTAKEFKNG